MGLRTEMDAVKTTADTLRVVEQKKQGSAVTLLSHLVVNLADGFNVGKNMGAEQCLETALAILEEYPLFTINDIALCFNKAKKGYYGEIYDRLDSAVIFKFLEQYYEAKLAALELYNRQKASIPEPPTEDTPEQKRIFAENMAKIKAVLAEKKAPEKTTTTVGNSADRFQLWMQQFDRLYQRRGRMLSGVKFIKRYGKWLDVSGFLKCKETQFNQFS